MLNPSKKLNTENYYQFIIAEKFVQKLNLIKDPIIRYSLLVEFINCIIEPIAELALEKLESDSIEVTDEELHKIQKYKASIINLTKQTSIYFEGLTNWIQQPIYSPDHPFGSRLMQSAKQNFENNA